MAAPGSSDDHRPGTPVTDLSPEARRRAAVEARLLHRPVPTETRRHSAISLVKRVVAGAWNDGFIHAGNLAYLSMLAIFPFFILGAAAFSLIGEPDEQMATIDAVLSAVPPVVGNVIGPVARSVVEARSGWLLWGGGLVGLWTVGSLIETIRDILRRAYGTQPTHAFWKYRVFSTGIIVASVILLILSLIAQVIIGAAQAVIAAHIPGFENLLNALSLSRVIPAIGLFFSLYLLFYTLTPAAYRSRRYPKWPGALLVTAWWIGVTILLPPALRSVFSYDLTYGSLAGMMITLFFFWLVGLGMVVGAELNAALAVTPEETDSWAQSPDGEPAPASPANMKEKGSFVP